MIYKSDIDRGWRHQEYQLGPLCYSEPHFFLTPQVVIQASPWPLRIN